MEALVGLHKSTRRFRVGALLKILLLILGIAIIASVVWLYRIQRNEIESLNAKVSSITLTTKSLAKSKTQLATRNANLASAVKLLQSQITASKTQITDNPTQAAASTPPAAGSLDITAVTTAQISTYLSPTNAWPYPSIPAIAVHVTLRNLTNSNQSYGASQFGAITDQGVVAGTFDWTPNISQTPWISTEIVPGATLNEIVYYNTGQNLVTLTWQPPGGTATLQASFPPVQ